MKPAFKEALDNLLLEGDADYISLMQVIGVVSADLGLNWSKLTVASAEKLWHGVQELVILMLENGFEVADLAAEGKYEAWSDQNPVAVIAEIKKSWSRDLGQIGHSVWFNKIGSPDKGQFPVIEINSPSLNKTIKLIFRGKDNKKGNEGTVKHIRVANVLAVIVLAVVALVLIVDFQK
jgi:hypothetical protein